MVKDTGGAKTLYRTCNRYFTVHCERLPNIGTLWENGMTLRDVFYRIVEFTQPRNFGRHATRQGAAHCPVMKLKMNFIMWNLFIFYINQRIEKEVTP